MPSLNLTPCTTSGRRRYPHSLESWVPGSVQALSLSISPWWIDNHFAPLLCGLWYRKALRTLPKIPPIQPPLPVKAAVEPLSLAVPSAHPQTPLAFLPILRMWRVLPACCRLSMVLPEATSAGYATFFNEPTHQK